MKDQTSTRLFLRQAINLIVVEIERRVKELVEGADRELLTLATLARQIGLEVPPLSPESVRIASELTWAPIAERYLVTLLRPLVQQSRADPKHTRVMCQMLWKEKVDANKLARETGLSANDGAVVQGAVETVLFESDLLKERSTLDWNGDTYCVQRKDGWLIVEDGARA